MSTFNEKYFLDFFYKTTRIQSQYLNLPTEISFNTCLSDCISFCRKRREVERIKDTRVFSDFYKFLVDDEVMKKINESEYINLIDKISKASNKAISYDEIEVYLKKIRFLFGKKHYYVLVEELKSTINDNDARFDKIEKLTMNFINELIHERLTYPYLSFAYNDYYKGKKYENVYDFIDYLAFEENENIEMYLPLKNHTSRDLAFLQSQGQQIDSREENGEKIVYCKVFANDIDFFNICSENMIRIESFFNLFKFYRESQIGFDYDKNVYIERTKVLKDKLELKFSTLISYTYFVGKQEIVENVIENINKLKNSNNPLFYIINNVLSYAEKDNDLLTVGSFVDNWIALETLIKVSGFKSGFDGVISYVPSTLSIQYYRKVLNETLKKCKSRRSIDVFFDDIFSSKIDFISEYYYSDREFINNEIQVILSYKSFKNKLDSIIDYLERDLYRIYNLRNEYVHSSNLTAPHGVQYYKLKRLLSDFFDVFMKTLNAHLKDNHLGVSGVDVVSDMQKKVDNRNIVFKIYSGHLKIDGNLIKSSSLSTSLSDKQIVSNIIFDRVLLLNHSYQEDSKTDFIFD